MRRATWRLVGWLTAFHPQYQGRQVVRCPKQGRVFLLIWRLLVLWIMLKRKFKLLNRSYALSETRRISTWIPTENGFIIDGYWSLIDSRRGWSGIRIATVPERANSVKVVTGRVFMRTSADPELERDELEEHTMVVGRAEQESAVVELLNRYVGFPPSPEEPE